ncbi:MAG: PorT family protein [Gemmatimonadaceae bacterium]|nr:PorT family protein [Chitinophagaceae bacterium]
MKKLILTAIGISALAVASAQNSSFGPIHGISHSWMTGTDNLKFKPGLTVGKSMVYSFNENWGVGHDITVSFFEGYKTDVGSENFHYTQNASYIRAPFKVIHFFGALGNRFRPKIYAGPSVGYLAWGTNRSVVDNGDVKNVAETKVTSVMKRWDLGAVAGTGFNFRVVPNIWLTADVAYYNGFLDVSKADSYNQNRNITASLGLTFPIGTHMMHHKKAAETK